MSVESSVENLKSAFNTFVTGMLTFVWLSVLCWQANLISAFVWSCLGAWALNVCFAIGVNWWVRRQR